MDNFLKNWKLKKRVEIIEDVEKYVSLTAKTISGRAVMLIKFLDLNDKYISFKIILNLALYISNEIKSYLIQKGYEGTVLNILVE